MAYIKINGNDYSKYCNQLKVDRVANYNAQTNAAGNTVVDYINHKRTITVGIIPLDSAAMIQLQADLANLSASISFRNPQTGALEEANCILPSNGVEYYTIQAGKVLYNAFELEFQEL